MTRTAAAHVLAGGFALLALTSGAFAPLTAASRAQAQEQVLYVSAYDTATRAPVPDLGPEAFIVREDGVQREILNVTPATDPMALAIVFDNSAQASSTVSDLRRGLQTFLTAVDGIGPTALVGIADRPTIVADYTTDTSALTEAAGRIFAVPGSGATLLDAIREVAGGLGRRSETRASIVLVVTERTEFSQLHHQQVLDALDESGAALHALVLVNPGAELRDPPARERAIVLDQGTALTGGVRFDVLSSIAYEGRLREMAALLTSQYRVTYARPDSLIPPEETEITAAKPGLTARGTPARNGPQP